MRNTIGIFAASFVLAAAAQIPAHAFGADGHRQIGSLADRMLVKHPDARNQVRDLLGTLTLANVAPWADCLRSVKRQPNGSFRYVDTKNPSTGRDPFPECDIFETAAGRGAMEDFVSRNWSECFVNATECHTKYHFINLAIQPDRYTDGLAGTTKFDIAHALAAAIATLQEKPVPSPFSMTRRDALILLVHYMGDVHQPLHVGQVYLDEHGAMGDPDLGTGPSPRSTYGGNQLTFFDGRKTKLHGDWDGVVVGDYSVADARKVAPTEGPMEGWISLWVTDTLTVARGMPFAGMTFGTMQGGEWNVVFADRSTYRTECNKVQRVQMEKAGARLTQLLVAIWPD